MYIVKQGGRADYNYKEYFLDKASDLAKMTEEDVKDACPGSVLYIIETGEVYMLNSEKEWVKQ